MNNEKVSQEFDDLLEDIKRKQIKNNSEWSNRLSESISSRVGRLNSSEKDLFVVSLWNVINRQIFLNLPVAKEDVSKIIEGALKDET